MIIGECPYTDCDVPLMIPIAPSKSAVNQKGNDQMKETVVCACGEHTLADWACCQYCGAKLPTPYHLTPAPTAPSPVDQCVHGHTSRQVGCVSCVLLFTSTSPVDEARHFEQTHKETRK